MDKRYIVSIKSHPKDRLDVFEVKVDFEDYDVEFGKLLNSSNDYGLNNESRFIWFKGVDDIRRYFRLSDIEYAEVEEAL